MLSYSLPVRICSGENAVTAHKSLFRLGTGCLIVTGKHAAKASGALDDVLSVLTESQITYHIFDGITANPLLADCMTAGRIAACAGVSFVIGIGGGSAMDAAKAIAVLAANPDLDEKSFYSGVWPCDPLPILLVGTTAGTGSEVTDVSVLTDSAGRKHSIHDPRMYAAACFGDPRYLLSMSRRTLAASGIDVLAHCTESYLSRKADALSRAYAAAGIRLLLPALSRALEETHPDAAVLEELYEASLLGGLAIGITGTVFPHNVGYYLTERFGLEHGFACAVFLPALLQNIRTNVPQLYARFTDETGCTEAALNALCAKALPPLKIQLSEAEIESALPRWKNNKSVLNTPGTVTTQQIGALLHQLFTQS